MSELVDRFRRYAERVPLQERAPVPAAPPPRGLPPGFGPVDGPAGPVPQCSTRRAFSGGAALASRWPHRLAGAELGSVEGWRFLDLETTGLGAGAGNRAFLVGVGALGNDGLTVRQYLLGDLDQEEALLACVLGEFAGATAVVTFNGKAFDWPLLRDRCLLAGVGRLQALPHWDVLHAARRLFRAEFAGCDLRRLEADLLGSPRGPDVQGAEIPALYGAWLDGDGSALDRVAAHHLEDICALVGVAGVVAAALEGGARPGWPAARLWGLGRSYEALGETDLALAAYLAARRSGLRAAGTAAARLLKRVGRREEALAIWEAERRGPVPSLEAAVEVAKDLEHRQRAPQAALRVVQEAVPLAAAVGSDRQDALRHRLERLQRKVASAGGEAGEGE